MDSLKLRLEFYMIRAGLNPTSLSRKAKLNASAVRDILQHHGSPDLRISTLVKLCKALDVLPYMLSPEISNLYTQQQRRAIAQVTNREENP